MKNGVAIMMILLWMVTSGAMAKSTDPEVCTMFTGNTCDLYRQFPRSPSRQDTVWWGNEDEQNPGHAILGGIWDFGEPPGSFQGWYSIDLTENLDIYFDRVSSTDFENDPVNPMMAGAGNYQLWCGIHEADAAVLEYVTGMGYGNNFCQSAWSPEYAAGSAMTVDFTYFNDSEAGWDYTYLYVNCYDAAHELIDGGEIEIDRLTGNLGSPATPLVYSGSATGGYPAGTAFTKFEIRFVADGGWSDEDGLYDCIYGPLGVDGISVAQTGGGGGGPYTFETGDEGWTFSKCEGVGSYLGLVCEETYTQWLEFVGLVCTCTLSGCALEFVDEEGSPYPIPGHPAGQHEQANSGIVDRGDYLPPDWNTTIVFWDNFVYLRNPYGCFYRQGYVYFPFTTEVNPTDHWSPRMGQNTHYYTGDDPSCGLNATNLTTLDGQAGDPMPNSWTQMRFAYQVFCSCVAFGIPSTVCVEEGNTSGTPLIDNVRVGLTNTPNAPAVSFSRTGMLFQDGFGQTSPTYLDPADVGNANITLDLSNHLDTSQNDWLADTTSLSGPTVTTEENRFYIEMCFQVYPGPRQHLIPEYMDWKSRLAGDPETGVVCVLMDSVETDQDVFPNKFQSYFHEDDPAYRAAFGDLSEQNEILPDLAFVPGTSVEYYYRSYWYNGGAPPEDYFFYPHGTWEFEILPDMRSVEVGDSFGQDLYEVVWPCVLYVDADNRGVERYVKPAFEQNGIEYDKYDYLDAASNWKAPMARSFGGTTYNPGGYGNNGLTSEQLLGYRLIFWNTGTFGLGCGEINDWSMLNAWMTTTECGLDEIRRGIILDGVRIAVIAESTGLGQDFLNNGLGVTYEGPYEGDDDCVFLVPAENPISESTDRTLALYGNGCPQNYAYSVLGKQAGVSGVLGSYDYMDSEGNRTSYAQVVRDHSGEGRDFRSIVDGFSLHNVTYHEDIPDFCPTDSASIVESASLLLNEMLQWLTEPSQPWDPWFYSCTSGGTEVNDETHLSGPVNHLFATRPNPFHSSAAIRFSLAKAGQVDIFVVDVSGRLVRTIVHEPLEAGEHTVTWDGADNEGKRISAGIYWVTMSTGDYSSGKRMVTIGQ